jgi:hypothetical protein
MNVMRTSVVLSTVALLLRCANVDLAGTDGEGNGSETVARGTIVDSTGVPSAGIPVQLLPSDYNPLSHDSLPAGYRAFTDSRGEYRLDGIRAGTYALEAGLAFSGQKALVKRIEIPGGKIEVAVDTGRLRQTGTVIVRLEGVTPRSGDYVYLPGTSEFAMVAARDSIAGQAVLSGVPAGTFAKLIYVAVKDSRNTDILGDTMTVAPGDTVASAYAAWKYTQKLFLNTSGSGANIAGNVLNFPVLVRLKGAAFDFSRAKSKGEDVRFTKSDGTPLAHEVERWDPAAAAADIWVKVDTVRGNNSGQAIHMYWGNPRAVRESSGAAVFDTGSGFQGVWHLGDVARDSIRDATGNCYHGVSPDSALPLVAGGVIGNCRQFDGSADFITMPNTAGGKLNFPQDGKYSVSAWVKADTLTDLQQTVVSKGMFQYFLWMDSASWQFWEFQDRKGWEASAQKQQAAIKQWVLLTAVRDGAVQHIYVNGESADSLTLKSDSNQRNTASDLIIGRAHQAGTNLRAESGFCYFRGNIDEIRLSNRAYSSDWIKLCYMNQQIEDRLVVYGK